MTRSHKLIHAAGRAALAAALLAAGIGGTLANEPAGIAAEKGNAEVADFDIVHALLTTDGATAEFRMAVSGQAGASHPSPVGTLASAAVFAYVWPTSLDAATVGFAPGAGILALAVTAHPDFDDTPREDENGDGDAGNDGDLWHSHWVVLEADESCGAGALKVVDIPPGTTPTVPVTWPELPILIDSPGWQPHFEADSVVVRVEFDAPQVLAGARFDGVTAGLRVNADVHAPLLCVVDVFDVASGDLSLPGTVDD